MCLLAMSGRFAPCSHSKQVSKPLYLWSRLVIRGADLSSVRQAGADVSEDSISTTRLFVVCLPSDLSCVLDLGELVEGEISVTPILAYHKNQYFYKTIEGMAAHLVELIRAHQATGPYFIAGYSVAGALAYEVLNCLVGADEFAVCGLLIQTSEVLGHDGCVMSGALAHASRMQSEVQEELSAVQLYLDALAAYTPQKSPTLIRCIVQSTKEHAASLPIFWKLPRECQLHLIVLGVRTTESHIHGELGDAVIRAVSDATPQSQMFLEATYSPLIPLKSGSNPSIFCIPGAGASVTSFVDLCGHIKESWSVYGLQPRGLDGLLVPHATVRAAAKSYIAAVETSRRPGPIHLVGHSFGGWVALEMAISLSAIGSELGSLTIVDSTPFDSEHQTWLEYTPTDIAMKWIETIELVLARPLNVLPTMFEPGNDRQHRELIHSILVHEGLLPRSTHPNALLGPVRAFGMALRADYFPRGVYAGPAQLLLADHPKMDRRANEEAKKEIAKKWKRVLPQIQVEHVPGNHLTLLKNENARTLASLIEQIVIRAD